MAYRVIPPGSDDLVVGGCIYSKVCQEFSLRMHGFSLGLGSVVPWIEAEKKVGDMVSLSFWRLRFGSFSQWQPMAAAGLVCLHVRGRKGIGAPFPER